MSRRITIEHELENDEGIFDITITCTTDGRKFWDTEVTTPFGEIPFTSLPRIDRESIWHDIMEAYASWEPDYEL